MDDDWGTLVWLVMTTGVRRGELCGLRFSRIDFDEGVIDLRKNWVNGKEKDTKTHQNRRIALDTETVVLLKEQRERMKVRVEQAARDADDPGLLAHAVAQQAFVLCELGEFRAAVEQLACARTLVSQNASRLLRACLAAAHGEGLAPEGRRDEALRAFDAAGSLLPADPVDPALPFLFLGSVHLDRWRGHALARLGDSTAVNVLVRALERLDPTFTRAEISLRVDLAVALSARGDLDGARVYAEHANGSAAEIGSLRQQHRLWALVLY